ncbi:MAG: hypothetical protein KF785_14470 [Gemmatimonadales bacterium]|mgnify:CR=1 FL=1|nr:hypothetical protein [Gemmatimonadales bacterium]
MFVPACGDQASVVVEHATSAGWAPYVSGFCLAALAAAPIPLAAGGTLTGSVSIPGKTGSYRLRPRFSVDIGGTEIVGASSAPVEVP